MTSRPSKTIRPAGWPVRAGDRPQERRLAGAVRAHERELLALGDLEADVPHRLQQAVLGEQVVDREEAHATAPPR